MNRESRQRSQYLPTVEKVLCLLHHVERDKPDTAFAHFENGTVLALDTLQEAWFREFELEVQVGQLIVAPCLRLLLHKLRQIASVLGQAQVLVVNNAYSNNVIKKKSFCQ